MPEIGPVPKVYHESRPFPVLKGVHGYQSTGWSGKFCKENFSNFMEIQRISFFFQKGHRIFSIVFRFGDWVVGYSYSVQCTVVHVLLYTYTEHMRQCLSVCSTNVDNVLHDLFFSISLYSFKMEPSVTVKEVKILETAEDIQERREQVLKRYVEFKESARIKREKLEDSRRFQYFR